MKTLKKMALITVIVSFFFSCSKEDSSSSSGNSYPKQVSITYKVTSTTTNAATLVQYKNETGGNTDVPNPVLPYTKTLTKTVNAGDVLTLGYGTNTIQTVKIEIQVNDEIVKSQEFTSTSGAIVYSFQ
ncbi:conserved exported hypothetical protein [Flavobacterium sp. 9AF]|uniref:hypothetical protein n=1 Tax=Flavobacterium sp. 9AF TaxID=2653142 RepID=UPI0012F03738|nr:hypothetical protein [Flavobacterium sp. 9AF]VXB99745.1 conserved exported hypothetical protein [Flavobacterium sp. 9AF]